MGGTRVKIKTKLSIEVVLLASLVGMVALTAIWNTKQVQESFLDLSSETMPILDALKDMRLATSLITSTTMEIMLLEEQFVDGQSAKFVDIEEQIEVELFEIENGKALFTEAFTRYSILMENNSPDSKKYRDNIAKEWNQLIFVSNKMISLKSRGAIGEDILKLKSEYDDAQHSVNQAIHSALIFTEPQVTEGQKFVQAMVEDTALTILVVLNIFIATVLAVRFIIVRSISKPLVKLRKATSEIAEGNFVKTEITGNDEIAALGQDIDKMSTGLAKLNKDIVSAERLSSIGSLASRLAHDLRNPLTVIKNSLEILSFKLGPDMDEKIDHQLAMVGRAVTRMSHQIEDVMDFVNISDLKSESSSIMTIIESALLSTNIPKTIKLNLPKNSVTVRCDPYKLEVVMSNLLRNACQAMDDTGEIAIRIIDQNEDVVIKVEDSGPGIPESVLPKIFEPLFTTKQTGTGLGLASCRSIIQKHGGTLTVRNNPTTFTIQLPKKPSNVPTREKVTENPILNE